MSPKVPAQPGNADGQENQHVELHGHAEGLHRVEDALVVHPVDLVREVGDEALAQLLRGMIEGFRVTRPVGHG